MRARDRRSKGQAVSALAACARKAHHPDRRAAEAVIAEQRARASFVDRPGHRLHAYACPACRAGWLVGNIPVKGLVYGGRRTA